jgi:hypothetical protein
MPRFQHDSPATLTPAEREWIRRQGLTARALEKERREVRDQLEAVAKAKRKLTEKRRVQV